VTDETAAHHVVAEFLALNAGAEPRKVQLDQLRWAGTCYGVARLDKS
jgi:hypothetical protein